MSDEPGYASDVGKLGYGEEIQIHLSASGTPLITIVEHAPGRPSKMITAKLKLVLKALSTSGLVNIKLIPIEKKDDSTTQ
jgi:hypothetical protein